MGQKRDDLAAGIRTFPVGKYLIIYEATSDAALVKRIVHGSRDVKAALDEKEA